MEPQKFDKIGKPDERRRCKYIPLDETKYKGKDNGYEGKNENPQKIREYKKITRGYFFFN